MTIGDSVRSKGGEGDGSMFVGTCARVFTWIRRCCAPMCVHV